MSIVTIVVPPPMRQFVGGQARVQVEATTVRDALDALAEGSDTLRGHLFDQDDSLNRFVRVFVDGRPSVIGSSVGEEVPDGAVVTVLLALAGG